MSMTELISPPKPFLRWAGGKTWLLKELENYLPENGFNKYIEPFLGGGAVFFHLQSEVSFLSDLNKQLTDTYISLKDNVEEIISELQHYNNTQEFYYGIRQQNPTTEIEKAARFIYLNQTSFNGIYRENLRGQYNVPFGYRKKDFLNPEQLRAASAALKNATIVQRDFMDSLVDVAPNDLVFIDPPYTVTHNNNGFIKYNAKLFDLQAQHRLSEFIDEIKARRAYYILTNAAHAEIKTIFEKDHDRMIKVSRASLIGGKNAKRGQYEEYIFTNVEPR
ncbi:Dam family site-specific DNA-(adenine-N6)-methyltransferase [Pedobacter panaciterrae]|nr:Dam family site-specific DNA-(adenine-N6)-methyltransferase [Pedobacter panaciterrae]